MKDHNFRILDPSWHAYVRFRDDKGNICEINPSAYCAILFNGQFRPLLISITEDARLFEAVILLGQTFLTGPRVTRFLNLYKAYEAITDHRRQEFSAVRHALAHAGTALTRPKTVETLERLFGGTYINLDCHAHRAGLYRQFGRMLIETDRLIYDAIMRQFPTWMRIRSWSQLRVHEPAWTNL